MAVLFGDVAVTTRARGVADVVHAGLRVEPSDCWGRLRLRPPFPGRPRGDAREDRYSDHDGLASSHGSNSIAPGFWKLGMSVFDTSPWKDGTCDKWATRPRVDLCAETGRAG